MTPRGQAVVPVDRVATFVGGGVLPGHAARAVELMSSRLGERWTLGLLAGEVHLSRSQLVRVFRATVDLSPMACLRQIRVQHMAHLLRSTDLSIGGVAEAVGWTDANHASRCFRRHYGVSPTEYRRQQTPLRVNVNEVRLRVWIRRAQNHDLASIGRVVERAYTPYIPRVGRRPAPMDEDYAEKLSTAHVFVAGRGSEVQGVLVLLPKDDHLFVENVAVDPTKQGTGVGTALLAYAEGFAIQQQLYELRLYTNVAMMENLAFYPRLGFTEVGRRQEAGFNRVYFVKALRPVRLPTEPSRAPTKLHSRRADASQNDEKPRDNHAPAPEA